MRRQKGSITLYGALAAGVVILLLLAAVKVQSARLEATQANYDRFVGQTETNGLAAIERKKAKETADKNAKDKYDKEYNTMASSNASLSRQLRDARAARGFLPQPAADASGPSRISFDRAKLESALQRLDDGVSQLIARGDEVTLRLKLSQDWARETLK